MAAYGMPQKDFSNFSFATHHFGVSFKLTEVKFVLFIELFITAIFYYFRAILVRLKASARHYL